MAKKQDAPAPTDEGILTTTAKAIGVAAGKIAKLAGARPEAAGPSKSQKIPKLSKKHKSQLPRRQKKAAKKKAASKNAG